MTILPRLVVALLLAAVTVALAGDPAPAPPPDRPNVAITVFVGRTGGPAGTLEKVYKVLGQEGATTRMMFGWRTPLPTRASDSKGSDTAVTSYVYQNVGVTADLEVKTLGGDRLLVVGQIEISGAREGPAVAAAGGRPPAIATYQQALNVALKDGQKVRVAEGPDPDGGTMYLELRVDRIK